MTYEQAQMLQEFAEMLEIKSLNELNNNNDGQQYEVLQARRNQVIAELNKNGFSHAIRSFVL